MSMSVSFVMNETATIWSAAAAWSSDIQARLRKLLSGQCETARRLRASRQSVERRFSTRSVSSMADLFRLEDNAHEVAAHHIDEESPWRRKRALARAIGRRINEYVLGKDDSTTSRLDRRRIERSGEGGGEGQQDFGPARQTSSPHGRGGWPSREIRSEPVSIRLDLEVLAHFRRSGRGWQSGSMRRYGRLRSYRRRSGIRGIALMERNRELGFE